MTKIPATMKTMKSLRTGSLALGIGLTLSTAASAQNWFQDFNRQSLWFHENAKRVLEGKDPDLPGPDVKPRQPDALRSPSNRAEPAQAAPTRPRNCFTFNGQQHCN